MISSGMSILRSLYVLEEQTESDFLKETIVAVRKDVEAGLSLVGIIQWLFTISREVRSAQMARQDCVHVFRLPTRGDARSALC